MSFLDYFRSSRKPSAAIAKERLQIVVAHERSRRNAPDYLPLLQQDILAAIRKYVPIDDDCVTLQVDRDGDMEVLELNVTLGEKLRAARG